MPWKECDKMTERLKFISRLLNHEKMTDLCREYGISRVSGYTILNRYKQEGLSALNDRSKRPWRLGHQTPADVETSILDLKAKHPTWGAPKILAYLQKKSVYAKLPARSTVHAILDRHGLVKHRRRVTFYKSEGTNLSDVRSPNDLWCADFKGQFKMGNQKYCYPLTITDQMTRYLLTCEGLENTREAQSIEIFKRTFREYGVPSAIRTDNGTPFATRTMFGLSKLTILWLRLGINIERIQPGRPDQNGRHERMHRTLKECVTKPAGQNLLQQQEMLDHFKNIFNNERPHEALDMKCPGDLYVPSLKPYPKIFSDYEYPADQKKRTICFSGKLRINGRSIFISDVFAGQEVGVEQIEDDVWTVTFMKYPLGYFSGESDRFYTGANPFLAITSQKV